ncbi:growth-regulating factor 10-like isoform X2 [Alnus glutinosa]|uniref:growth-regulating factor 10-like isoform X2 n=1 Tax=Alnus glutinosa TaxID=3517 RepID=UPI002D7847EB|nr:growth-regulating factor 10-like isoform X2 [Alnus glutinosa]
MEFPTPPCKVARLSNSVGIGPSSWGNVMEMKTNGSIGGDGLNLELGSGSGHFRKSCGFTIFQLQELQLQTLIYKHMGAGLPVPYHLLLPIWKSVESSLVGPNGVLPPVYTSYNRIMMDSGPEPGRCRRTDGKKWRCSNEPVPQKKYCERHMQRGRQRSRKLVETSQPLSTSIGVSPSSNTNLSISLSVNSSSSSISSSCYPSE